MSKSRFVLAAVLFALLVAFVIAPASASAAPANWGYGYGGYYAPSYSGCNPCGTAYQGTASGYVSYQVQWGDTLSLIAARFGTTTWYLASLNGLYNPNCLFAGQVILVPSYSYGGYASACTSCGSYGYGYGGYSAYSTGYNYGYGYGGYKGYGVSTYYRGRSTYGPYPTYTRWGRR